jgi:hypothetical protein
LYLFQGRNGPDQFFDYTGPAAAGARGRRPDAAIARGIADVDAGCVKPLSKVFDRLEAKYREAIDTDTKRR